MTLTPVEIVNGIWLKRDDLFNINGAPGGKARTCLSLAQKAKEMGKTGLVTAGSRASPQVNIVARVAKYLGMSARCHTPTGTLSPEVLSAKEMGAEIIQHRAGYNNVIIARAREDAAKLDYAEIPFGMECQEAVTQTRFQVRNIPTSVKRIVIPVGSGMSLAGVLHGLHDVGLDHVKVVGIKVGADPTKRLEKYAPFDWRFKVDFVSSGIDYHKENPELYIGNVKLDPHYEAKCLPFLEQGDLFWIVGIRQTALEAPM